LSIENFIFFLFFQKKLFSSAKFFFHLKKQAFSKSIAQYLFLSTQKLALSANQSSNEQVGNFI